MHISDIKSLFANSPTSSNSDTKAAKEELVLATDDTSELSRQ